jgi:hypothetical protein
MPQRGPIHLTKVLGPEAAQHTLVTLLIKLMCLCPKPFKPRVNASAELRLPN